MRKLFDWLSFFIAPPFCRYCRKFLSQRTIFCDDCFTRINPIATKDHELTSTKTMRIFAISVYQEPLRSLITAKLYSDQSASKELGQLMWRMTVIQHIEFDYLIPVPLHWTRYAKRGFNQAEEIAREISSLSGKPIARIVKRVRATDYQSQLDRDRRTKNVSDAFFVKDSLEYHGKRFLLVDDLYTTGSTVHAMARELLKLKPASIDVVVACRTI